MYIINISESLSDKDMGRIAIFPHGLNIITHNPSVFLLNFIAGARDVERASEQNTKRKRIQPPQALQIVKQLTTQAVKKRPSAISPGLLSDSWP